jgi:large conductance mechanosensitive channel
MGIVKEFREFAIRGNVVDMAVGIIIGASFGAIVKSFVDDLIMPVIGLLLGNNAFQDFHFVLREGKTPGPYDTLAAAREAQAVTLNYGAFFNVILTFVLTALAVFIMIKSINRLRREQQAAPAAPTDKPCPYCAMTIPVLAQRCPHCTSQLAG